MIGMTALVLALVAAFVGGCVLQATGFCGWLNKKMPWGKCKGGCK